MTILETTTKVTWGKTYGGESVQRLMFSHLEGLDADIWIQAFVYIFLA